MPAVTARAHPNIAFIKYWGNADDRLKLPVNSSLSMNLAEIYTDTTLEWGIGNSDVLVLNGEEQSGTPLQRVVRHLDLVRARLNLTEKATVVSTNNFPMGAGIASSASSFAALTLAATRAANAHLEEKELTTLARIGSGSASRSIPTGFVEWHKGSDHESSYAESIFPPDHWNLIDVIAVINVGHKKTGSEAGHPTAKTSDLQLARISGAAERLAVCKQAITDRNFPSFAEVVEMDSNLMHAVMLTSHPPLMYWLPASIAIMQSVREWRGEGLNVCFTLDAGPNVHCLCTQAAQSELLRRLQQLEGIVELRVTTVGQGTVILS